MDIVGGVFASVFIIASLWTLVRALLGVDARSVNRRIHWYTNGPHVDDIRESSSLIGQLSWMSMANVVAGGLAGLGFSMYASNGKLDLIASEAPIFLIGGALVVVQFVGFFIGRWATRPRRDWITNPYILEATLQQSLRDGLSHGSSVDELEHLLDEFKSRTTVPRLKTRHDLEQLNVAAPSARLEWLSVADHDPKIWTARVRKELGWRSTWRWAWRRRRFSLVIPPALATLSAAALCVSLGFVVVSIVGVLAVIILGVVLAGWCATLVFTVQAAGRAELVMVNRLAELEAAKLRSCEELVQTIRTDSSTAVHRAELQLDTVKLTIGRWTLSRRGGNAQ